MANRSYEIFSGDALVAVWQDGALTVKNEALLPLYLKRVANADAWLETRAIDSHRANSRLLKKALRLAEKDDVSTVIHVNGATVTDNYWVRPIGSDLTYNDVKFTDDYFSGLAFKALTTALIVPQAAAVQKLPSLPMWVALKSAGNLRTASGGYTKKQAMTRCFHSCLYASLDWLLALIWRFTSVAKDA